ncbi:MAG: MBOAT family O-acyltransferase, partial [Cyclobacteriaceae bacterium]
WSDFLIAIPLPIGISFFTFQGISLLVDAYRNRAGTSDQIRVLPFWKLLFHTSLYISLFPQLVAGPIVKAHDFYPQIRTKYLSGIQWNYVFQHVVTGYFLKMVVADNLKDFTGELVWPSFERFSSVELLVYLFGYSMQIFADFAGYSLIAIGISGLFGYIIPQNFNFPYVASGFSDFWKRWHISLSTFLKEYLYIPLGGNRKGRVRTYLNLMIVMALGGLWHGALFMDWHWLQKGS